MPPPKFPLELLLMIAHHIRDEHGKIRYGDFNAFLQVNRALHACLNRILWKEAREHEAGAQLVFTHLIKTNDLAGLKFFLELGADVEVCLTAFDIIGINGDNEIAADEEINEPTPLLIAADSNNVPLARLLLEKGAKVQYPARGGFSPMHAARSAEMVQLLLNHNANPELEDGIERRPLHWYATRGDIAAMRTILQHGAVANPLSRSWTTPLHEAAKRDLDTVGLLVEHGADVKYMDPRQDTPLHLAALAGKTDVVRFLVERWPEGIRQGNEDLQKPLHLAAIAGNTDVVKFLVEQWPEGTRERDDFWNTPLHHAAYRGWGTEVVGLLVEGWPEAIGVKNDWGHTPLHLAAIKASDTEVVRLLVESWPEGKKVLSYDMKTPLQIFEHLQPNLQLNEEKKNEFSALLRVP